MAQKQQITQETQMQQNNFLDAFDEAIKLNEGVAEMAQKVAGAAKNAADTAVAKKQVKTQQANDQAKATSESLKPIMDILQPIANAQNQFDDNSIKQISDLINKLPNLDNGVKKQINQILNQQKTVLQQPEQPKDPAQGGNPDTQKAGETVDPNKQPAQGTEPAVAPAQGTEDNKQGVSKEEQQVVNTTTAQAAPQIAAMDAAMEKIKQFSQKSKYIAAAVQEWANFKDALNKTTNANKG